MHEREIGISEPIPVLNDGFVRLVDVMGDESSIVQAARVSYGEGTKTHSDDVTLIRYLMRRRHTTPFEMVELKFHVRVPMDCWRQWIRHRMASTNEYSTRYSEAIDSMQTTDHDQWRLQSTTNRQGSEEFLTEWPEHHSTMPCPVDPTVMFYKEYDSPGKALSINEQRFHESAKMLYDQRLALGVAREQARKDLPLSTYTEAYWKIDLHNLLHFLALRMDSHAQWEIRQYATIIGEQIVKQILPNVWQAFIDYRREAITLTRLDVLVMQWMAAQGILDEFPVPEWLPLDKRCRERSESFEKLSVLGLDVIRELVVRKAKRFAASFTHANQLDTTDEELFNTISEELSNTLSDTDPFWMLWGAFTATILPQQG